MSGGAVSSGSLEHWVAPVRFQAENFALRSYDVGDGPLLAEALAESYEHLSPWMPWAKPEPGAAESEQTVRHMRGRYLLGDDFALGAFSPDGQRLLAGCGFHLREGPLEERCAEIGMWVRAGEAGRGLGTGLLEALLCWGFRDWPWLRLSWRCDARNAASLRVAEKGGLRREGVLLGQAAEVGPGRRDTVCFALTRGEWRG